MVSIALAHTGTAASEKSTLVQALHNGCVTLVGKNKIDHPAKPPNYVLAPFIMDISGPLLSYMAVVANPEPGEPPTLHIFDVSLI